MARTPLLRLFARLARDHQIAEDRGVSPAEVRSERSAAQAAQADGASLSRREFLGSLVSAGVGAVAGASLLGGTASAHTPDAARVAVVGGGIAGLNAALTLADAGIAATVYESSARWGGRMFSNTTAFGANGYWAGGQVSEWCGELVDTGHTTMQGLAARFGLPLDNLIAAQPAGSKDTFFFDGMPYTEADADFNALRPALKADLQSAGYPTTYARSKPGGVALDNMSVRQWIESRVPGGFASKLGQLLDVAYNIEYGEETSQQSALGLVYLLGYQPTKSTLSIFGESDETYHVRGGNQQIPVAIKDYLAAVNGAGTLKSGHKLSKIVKNASGTYTLTFQKATGPVTVEADQVILALPFAVLRTLDFSQAGFDALKVQAITQQGAGVNGKLMLQFDRRLWNEQGSTGTMFSDTGFQAGWEVSRAQPSNNGILVGYSGGDTTREFAPSSAYTTSSDRRTRDYAERLLSQLEPLFPGITARWNGKANLSIPPMDPNFKTAYSYWKVGQYHTFAGYEGVAQDNCHFCGEHCSIDFGGFMEGGASEGARAGSEVAAALGVHAH